MRDMASTQRNPPPSRLPLMHRKAACTHTTMCRLYGPYRCSHCGKLSRTGWVYRCTQDYGGELPPWEARSLDPKSARVGKWKVELKPEESNTTKESSDGQEGPAVEDEAPLKPWINDAIAKDQYSEEQVAALRAQKQRVIEAIRDAEASFHRDQTSLRRPLAEVPSNSSPNLRALSFARHKGSSSSMRSTVPLKMFPDCTYRTCTSCR